MDQGNTVAPGHRAVTPHTELPWRIDDAPDSNYGCQITANTKVKSKRVVCRLGGPDRDANADFIVRAVNSHYALVKALEDAAARFNLMAGVGLVNGADPKVGYREAMAALSAAKGET